MPLSGRANFVKENVPPIPGLIGSGVAMQEVYRLTRKVAKSDASVLLLGETGTGKELIATALHRLSHRGSGPFIRVNCGALPESLLESELFGHVRGAFTGAVNNRTGRFEAARRRGTHVQGRARRPFAPVGPGTERLSPRLTPRFVSGRVVRRGVTLSARSFPSRMKTLGSASIFCVWFVVSS